MRFNSSTLRMKLVAFMMNNRSAVTGICTGDQAIFVKTEIFSGLKGYPNIALMEDVALSKQLKKISNPVRIKTPVITSARRWETGGYLRTIFLMWKLRLFYSLGVSPDKLAILYRQAR